MLNTLFLASKSASRQQLLKEAQIPFALVEQNADEHDCSWALPLTQLVEKLALKKMDAVNLELAPSGSVCFVLTADTLSQDMSGTIQGKPVDRADAIAKIKVAREGARLATAFCLDRKISKDGTWIIDKRIIKVVTATYVFDVPEIWLERYLSNSLGLRASNAIAIEGYGSQFLKSIDGSFSTIVGLPMFQLRDALDELGFFESQGSSL